MLTFFISAQNLSINYSSDYFKFKEDSSKCLAMLISKYDFKYHILK